MTTEEFYELVRDTMAQCSNCYGTDEEGYALHPWIPGGAARPIQEAIREIEKRRVL